MRLLSLLLLCYGGLACQSAETLPAPLDIQGRLEPLFDDWLIDSLQNARLKLHQPTLAGEVLLFDAPWEGAFTGYITVLQDGSLFKMWYRGLPASGGDNSSREVTCYAESPDGIRWSKPALGLHELHGTRSNNVVLAFDPPFSSNFAPFLDTRPGVSPQERYKALAGTSKTGLFAFASEDGIHWRKLESRPVLKEGAFDSQNVCFWSTAEQCYVCYYRTWSEGNYKGIRSISRSVSTNFVEWGRGQEMTFGDSPREHLYTSQTQPYFRAPHIYLATPMRFMPARKVLSPEQAAALKVQKGYSGDCADTVLMTSRGGNEYRRSFMEAFIRPGLDPGNWASRAALTACGIVPTGPAEISIYKQGHYAQPSSHLLRYTLRTDGFVSLNAGYTGGEMRTKPLKFNGARLVLNFATSAAGGLKVEVQDAAGRPIPGYTLENCVELIGDDVKRVVQWQSGADTEKLAGRTVRLRLVMKDADLYSLRFVP